MKSQSPIWPFWVAVGYFEKWVRADTLGYRTMLRDFDFANKTLAVAARE
jgi:hypothetical protein